MLNSIDVKYTQFICTSILIVDIFNFVNFDKLIANIKIYVDTVWIRVKHLKNMNKLLIYALCKLNITL